MPQQWRNAIICLIQKKGDRTNCENYRRISLLDVTYKVLTRIIRNRLSLFHDTLIGEYQGDSGKEDLYVNDGTEASFEQNLSLHISFIDFKKAYDSIERNKLYLAMKKLKIPKKLIGLTRMTLTDMQNKISADGRNFGGNIGVRQGDRLSTMLFNAPITRSKKEIEKALSKLEKAAWDYGLRIKEEKTKYLIM
jgi:hypothetical protein